VSMMSYWTFDDVFEEGGVKRRPFEGGFGLIAPGRIKKPSFYDFSLLHKLGDERLANVADDVIVTRRRDGALVIAAWNLVDMDKLPQGSPREILLTFNGVSPGARVSIERVDQTHGNPVTLYKSMGSPVYPTMKQVAALNGASELSEPERTELKQGKLDVSLPVNGLALIEITNWK
jgi:xylan 1,4-beta-xylosidase